MNIPRELCLFAGDLCPNLGLKDDLHAVGDEACDAELHRFIVFVHIDAFYHQDRFAGWLLKSFCVFRIGQAGHDFGGAAGIVSGAVMSQGLGMRRVMTETVLKK